VKRTLVAAFAAAFLAAGGTAAADEDVDLAMEYIDNGQHVYARDHLRIAAENGNARAAEILGFMHGAGAQSFPGVQQDLREAAHWFDLAARGGRPVAQYMLCALRLPADMPPQASRRCVERVAAATQSAAR
jgi:TPR repeat protein